MVNKLNSVDEAAQQLGHKSDRTIRAWVLKRKIEYVKVLGGSVKIRQSVIDDIIERGTVPALADRRQPRSVVPAVGKRAVMAK